MLIYADTGDLETWSGETAPDNADILLREASILVGSACRADLYDALPSGLPEDDALADAMRDATCAHAGYWAANGIDPAKGADGIPTVVTSSSIDGASVSTNGSDKAAEALASLSRLSSSALRILRLAGLASGWVQS